MGKKSDNNQSANFENF